MISCTLKLKTSYSVHVSTYNDELVIGKCLTTLTQVFDVTVHDFGSQDSTADIASSFPVKYIKNGKLTPRDYTRYKRVAGKSDKVFWVDSDEEYPISQLLKLKTLLEEPDVLYVVGFWNNLYEDGVTLPVVRRGRIVWTPSRMKLVKDWPFERLQDNLTPEENIFNKELSNQLQIWCYHHIFMKRSNIPEDATRAAKRIKRKEQLRPPPS